MKFRVLGSLAFVAASALAACGGGGSGSSGGGSGVIPTSQPTVAATPTPTPTPLTLSGTAVEFTSGSALPGFTVSVGSLPNVATCNSAQTATLNVCGVPASPIATATTSASGAFSVTVPATGSYMLTISNGPTYATLHRSVSVTASLALGTVKVAALTADEQAWVVDVNNQRATVSVPVSFGNLVVDEYAEEQARQWAADTQSGKTTFGDAQYAPYQAAYSADAGSIYGATGVLALNLLGQTSAYVAADQSWMGEKVNCPGGNWQTCTFASNTGHYINVSNTNTVWVGLGESGVSLGTGYTYYDLMLIENAASSGPASVRRGPVAAQ